MSFGSVTAVDIADQAIQQARLRVSCAEFQSGDILEMSLPHDSFDLFVTLETLSPVGKQPQFIKAIANVLCDRGYLILTTQNRSAYRRNSRVAPEERVIHAKERPGLGQTLVVLARKLR